MGTWVRLVSITAHPVNGIERAVAFFLTRPASYLGAGEQRRYPLKIILFICKPWPAWPMASEHGLLPLTTASQNIEKEEEEKDLY